MYYSLLQIVQLILSSMDSDEVNSINDTTESYQVAIMAQSVFYDMCVELNLPNEELVFQLNASTDTTKPTIMYTPSIPIRHFTKLMYDNKDPTQGDVNSIYREVWYSPLDEFIKRQGGFQEDTQNVLQYSFQNKLGQSFNMMCQTDQFPMYYTTFDDSTILMDSIRLDIDSTLVGAKTLCYGNAYDVFLLQDTYTPALEPDHFSYFINKLKTRAWYELKNQENKESTMQERKLKIVEQKRKQRVDDIAPVFKVARYGRNSSYGGYDSILQKYGRDGT